MRDYLTIVSTQVHKGKETQQPIVVGIEIAILEGFVLGIPEGINKLLLLSVVAKDRCCCNSAYQTNAVAKLAESASGQNLILLRQRAIGTILIYKLMNLSTP